MQSRSFNWYQPSTLKVSQGGIYRVQFHISAVAPATNKTFKAELNHNLTAIDNVGAQRNFASGTDFGQLVASGFTTVTAGEYIWLSIKNKSSDTTDLLIYISNVNVLKI